MKQPPAKDTAFIDKIREEQGLPPTPKKDEVLPYPDLYWAWIGFWRLSNSRPQGMGGPLRILMSEIESYSRLMQLSYSQVQDFIVYVERLDIKFMEWVAEEAEKDKNKPKGKSP